MKSLFTRSISILLVTVMILGLIPGMEGLLGAAEAAGNIANTFVGQDADVFSALGFKTDVLPEGFDAETTDNPYGRDRLPGNQVFEFLRADNDGYSTFGKNNNNLDYSSITHSNSTSRAMPVYNGKEVDLYAGAVGDFDGDGLAGEVAFVGIVDLAGARSKVGGYTATALVLFVFDAKTGAYSGAKYLGDVTPYYTVKSKDAGVDMNLEANDQVKHTDRWQSLLQITAGDFDGDGHSEIAVYVAENGGARVEIYKYQRTSQSGDQDWLNMGEWSRVWSHPLSIDDNRVPNMVSLTAGDLNRDGVDDLAIASGSVTYKYVTMGDKINFGSVAVVFSEASTAIALWGGKSNMLQNRSPIDLGKNNADLGELARVSFTFGDITGDGTPELIMTGQRLSDLNANLSRSLATYVYDETQGLLIDAAGTFAVVDGSWETMNDGGGNPTTVFKTNNGYDQSYFSHPIMRTNSAVVTPAGNDYSYVYLDSVMYRYYEGSFSIGYELDDNKYNSESGRIPGDWANHNEGIYVGAHSVYSEYGAVSGDINGNGSDTLAVNFVVNSAEQYSKADVHATIFVGGTAGGGLKTNKKIALGKPVSITMPDIDYDTTLIEYSGIHYLTYSDPQVLAIIAAAPYFEDVDVVSNYDYGWMNTTSYSRIKGVGSSDIVAVDFSIGRYVSAEATLGGVKVELETSLGFTLSWEKETTRSTEYTLTFETCQDEDAVAFYSIPTENYVYYIYTYNSDGTYQKETSVISNTFTPCYQVLSLDYYESIQGNYDELPQIQGAAITSTPGDPSSYPSSANGYNVIAQWNDDPAGVSFGNGSITQEITITQEESETYQLGGYWNFQAGGGGKVQSDFLQTDVDVTGGVEWSLNPSGGWSTINLTGTSFAGTVANMPVQFQDYGYYYNWKLFAYNYVFESGMSIPVVSYIVGDVSQPPELPRDFQQDFEKSTSDTNCLTWTYDGAVTKFNLYKYYDFPVGGGLQKIAEINAGESANYTVMYSEERGQYKEYYFVDKDLTPYTEYQYAIQVERASPVPPLSSPSALLTVRTKAEDGYPNLSITESDGANDANLLLYPDKNSYLTVNVTGPDGQNPSSYYTVVQYQWQKQEKGAWKDLVNETGKTLTFSSAGVETVGRYRCRVNVLVKESATYITAYTDYIATTHAKRMSFISEMNVSDVAGGGIRLYAQVKNAHHDSTAVPTGIVTFTLSSVSTGIEYQRHAIVDGGTGIAEDITEAILPEGMYTVYTYYSGSFIFKSCATDGLYLSQMGSGYTINAPAAVTYGNGAEMSFQAVSKADGITSVAQVNPASARLFQGDKIFEGRPSIAEPLPDGNLVQAGHQYHFSDADGITYSFTATRNGTVEFEDGYAFYVTSPGDRIAADDKLEKDNTSPGRYTLSVDTPAGSYVIKMVATGDNRSVYALITVERKAVTLQLPKLSAGESSSDSMNNPVLGALPVVSGAWANCDYNGDALDSSIAETVVPVTYLNTAGQKYTNDTVLKMCGYYTVGHAVSTTLAGNYTVTFADGILTVLGATRELKVAARRFEGLNVGTVYVVSPEYGYTRDVLSGSLLTQSYPTGTRVVLTAVPDPGYQIYDWYINGVAQHVTANSLAHVMLNENTTIEVQFDIKKNTITFGAAGDVGGGVITCDDATLTSGSVLLANSLLNFTAVANPGYHFKEWRYTQVGSGSAYDNEDEGKAESRFEFIMPNSSCSVFAVFERDYYTLTLEDTSGNNGLTAWYYAMAEDGQTTTGEKVFAQSGAAIKGDTTVTVEPAKGCVFNGTYRYVSIGSQGVADYSAGTYVFKIAENTHVRGVTTREEYDLTLTFVVDKKNPATPDPRASIIYTVGAAEHTFDYDEGNPSLTVENIAGGSQVAVLADFPAYYNLDGWVHEGVTTFTASTEVDKLATALPAAGTVTKGSAYFYSVTGVTYYFVAPETGVVKYTGATVTLYMRISQYTILALDGDTELTLYLSEKDTHTVTLGDMGTSGTYLYDLPEGAVADDAGREVIVHSGDTFTVTVMPRTGITVAQWTVTQDGSLAYTYRATSLSYQFAGIQNDYTLQPVFAATTYNTISWPSINQAANGITLVPANDSVPSVSAGSSFSFTLTGAGVSLIGAVYANGNEFTASGNTVGGSVYRYSDSTGSRVYTITNITENQIVTVDMKAIGVTVSGVDISEFSGTGWNYIPSAQELQLTRSGLTISGANNTSLAPGLSMSFGESAGTITFRNLKLETNAAAAVKSARTAGVTITLAGSNKVSAENAAVAGYISALTATGDVTFRGNGSLDISATSTSTNAGVVTLNLPGSKLTATGNVNMSVSAVTATTNMSKGVEGTALEVGVQGSTVSPTLRVTATGANSTAVSVMTVRVFGGSLLVNGARYGLRALVIDNYDGIMEISGTESAFEKISASIPDYQWTAYYEKGFQLRTKKSGDTKYITESQTGYGGSFVLISEAYIKEWPIWLPAWIKALLGLDQTVTATYDYVLISALEAEEKATIPLAVSDSKGGAWSGNLAVTAGQDAYYYLKADGSIEGITFDELNSYGQIVLSSPTDADYLAVLELLQRTAQERKELEFAAKYDSAENTLVLGSFAFDPGALTGAGATLGNLIDIDPEDEGVLETFKGLFSDQVIIALMVYTPATSGTVSAADGTYKFSLSGTIADPSDSLAAPIVDASGDAVDSLTLNGYASTGLVMGRAPLSLNGTNYLTHPTGSPLVAADGALDICGIITESGEENYPKDINDTLTLTTGAGAGDNPVIRNDAAAGALQITLTNVKALTAYGQIGAKAVSTEYAVTYHDGLLSGEDGAYGYAWLQDLSVSSAAAAVTQQTFNPNATGYNYLKLYAATSDAGASEGRFVYDRSNPGANVLSAEIYAPAVLGLVHKFGPATDATSRAELLDGEGSALPLVLNTDYTWNAGVFELLISDGAAAKDIARGSYTVKLFFYDEDTSNADFYTLSIPLTVMETETSSGGLSVSPETITARRGKSVNFTTAFVGPTPTTYVWEIEGASTSDGSTKLVTAGASATLVVGATETGTNGVLSVRVRSYESEDTTAAPLGTAVATVTVAPTALNIAITCVNETPSGDGSYTLYHNTADGTPKSWTFEALVTLDDDGTDTDVAWSLWGASLSGTDVNGAGILTVHPSETGTNGLLKLTATYTHGDGSTFQKTIDIHLSSDAFVSYVAAGTNGAIAGVRYGTAQTAIAESGAWVPKNNTVTATATPAEGYIVKTWYVNGVSVMGNAAYTVDAENHKLQFTTAAWAHYQITADYINASSYRVTYSVSGSNGSVSAVYNGSAFASGGYVTKGDSVTIQATPNQHFVISHWVVDEEIYEVLGAVYTGTQLTLSDIVSDRTVSVVFVGMDLEVRAVAAQSGGGVPEGGLEIYLNGAPVTPQPVSESDGSESYTIGARTFDSVLLFASPKPGYQVKTWKIMQGVDYVELAGTGETLTYSVAEMTADLNVLVVFEPIPEYHVTVYSNSYENGTGTVVYGLQTVAASRSDVFQVIRHGTATFVAVPDPGSYLYDWTVEDAKGKPYTEYTEDGNVLILRGVTEDVVIRARFRTTHFTVSLATAGDGELKADYSNPADNSAGTVDESTAREVKGGSTVVLTATPTGRSMLTSLRVNGTEVTPVLDASVPAYRFTIDALAEDIHAEAEFTDFDYYDVTAPEDYQPGGTVAIMPANDGFSRDADPGDRTVEIAGGSGAHMTFSADADYLVDASALRSGLDGVLADAGSSAGYTIALTGSDYVVALNGVDRDLDFSQMATPFVAGSQTTFTVTIPSASGGTVVAYYQGMSVLDGARLPDGAALTVIAIPDAHYQVASLTGNAASLAEGGSAPAGVPLPAGAYIATTTLGEDSVYRAQFEVSEYKVAIAVLGLGAGRVTVEGAGKQITATDYMPAGSELVVTAEADDGAILSYLVVGGAVASGGTETVDSLDRELTIVAVFDVVASAVTFHASENGTLHVYTASGDEVTNGQVLPVGTLLAIIAVPDAHYKVSSLTGGGTAISGNTYRVDATRQNAIECLFARSEAKVSWTNPDGGTIAVTYGAGPNNGEAISSGGYVPIGTYIRITAKANSNYEFGTLTLNGVSIANNPQTQHVINTDTLIAATFKSTSPEIIIPTPDPPPTTTYVTQNQVPLSDGVFFLKVSVVGNGTVKVQADDTAINKSGGSVKVIESGSSIEFGTVLTVTATPANGTSLRSLRINGVEVENGVKYEVYANADIVAVFDVTIPYYLNADGARVFLGLAFDVDKDGVWDAKDYIAPAGAEVRFTENTKTFADTAGHWAGEHIGFVASREIFLGVETTKFAPDTSLSRAMFVAVIGRLYERSYGEITAAAEHAFTDCDYTAYYGKYVDWAAENGIIRGYGEGLFGPNDLITREQMAAIMFSFAKLLRVLPEKSDASLLFRDVNDISGWASEAVLFCQTTQLMQGIGDGLFAPSARASRAEAATITTNFIQYILTKMAE